MKIAGVKINKTTKGQIKEIVINYSKFQEYVDDFLDGLRATKIQNEDLERFDMDDVFNAEYKRRGLKK